MPWIWRIIAIIADASPFSARPGWRPLRVTRPTLNLSFALFLVIIFSLPQQPRLWWLHCSIEHHLARPGNKTAVPRAPPLLPPGATRPPCQHLFPPWGALAPLLLVQSAAAQVRARLPETTSSLSFTLQGWWSQSKGRKRRRESQNDRHNVIASMIYDGTGSIEGGTDWYLVVLGQYGAELVYTWWYWNRAVLVDMWLY